MQEYNGMDDGSGLMTGDCPGCLFLVTGSGGWFIVLMMQQQQVADQGGISRAMLPVSVIADAGGAFHAADCGMISSRR
ncbi:MAG: hypothetical protein Tsb002_03840 [Wenzhouxiangellaceae bacterium]